MAIVLTGGTGLVGSAVLTELVRAGHQVTAVVRSEDSAAAVSAAGATPVIGDLGDQDWLTGQFAQADGAIHTASPGDASSADFDTTVVRAAVAAYRGTGKPYVHTGGVWVYGSGEAISEQTPFAPPALTAWRPAVEQILLDEATIRGVVVQPAIVYRGRAGLPGLVTTPAEDGTLRSVGSGTQHWTTVHADELAVLYRLVYEDPQARGYYIGANGGRPTVAEIVATGSGQVVAETVAESRERLSAPLADALLLDQIVGSTRAAAELGWNPAGPSLLSELGR